MSPPKRRRTPTVKIGPVKIGSGHPVVIQSMTDTPTSNVQLTVKQSVELIDSGAEMVRLTVNNTAAAKAVPEIVKKIRDKGHQTPVIGDFHYNGHILLTQHPLCAKVLDKYRINPGNVGKGKKHNANFDTIIKAAKENGKPVRIGVNWGSLDSELLTRMMDRNARLIKPRNGKEVIHEAMVRSVLESADRARRLGLKENQIVLSVKMSHMQDMISVYSILAERCRYVLHLGLTEAGNGLQGIISSSASLAVLLQQGIGDTIRVSLTPEPGVRRSMEVEVCKELLQSMGLRYFSPAVVSCPGCGRTCSNSYRFLALEVKAHVRKNLPRWKKLYPGVETLTIAVMGCVVNGPGESSQADIGISLPGSGKAASVPVYVKGKLFKVLKGGDIKKSFFTLLENFIKKTYVI